MNAPFRIFDTLQNLVSGLGTSKDKTVHTSYVLPQLDRGQLNNAYRGDWIARKVIDIPAQDATRMWRQWQAENDQIEKLEDYERNLGVQDKIRRAMQRARLYGGAAIVIGTGDDARSEEELDVERLGKDSLKFLHVVSQHDLPADEFETDVMSPYYGEPKFYRRSLPRGEQVKIHPSRVVRFIGAEIPDQMLMNGGVWGDSVLQVVNDAVLSAGSVAAGVAALVQEAKRDVVHIPDLGKHLSTQEYTDKLTSRLMYANSIKSMINTTVLDENEKWEQMQVNFGTLPDVLKMYLMIASGAADIPATRMLGQSPSGMNSTGESDTRNYYDRVRSEQSTVMQPALSRLDEVIIRSALGTRPPEIYYEWASLWQMTEAEEADLAAKKAANFKIEVDLGLINPDALREVRINQLIEDGTYPGLEAAIEEHGDEPEEQDDDEILGAFAELQKKQKMLAPPEPGGKVMPFQKKRVGDSNPFHLPAGSERGGQFTSGPGGGSSIGNNAVQERVGTEPNRREPSAVERKEFEQQKSAVEKAWNVAKSAFDTPTKIMLWGAAGLVLYKLWESGALEDFGFGIDEATKLHADAATDIAHSVARDNNFPLDKVFISHNGTTPVIGSYNNITGNITVFHKNVDLTNPKEMARVMSHEIMHDTIKWAALNKNNEVMSFIKANTTELQRTGGQISDYARRAWEVKQSKFVALNETLAEMAAEKSITGRLPGSDVWKRLFEIVQRQPIQRQSGIRSFMELVKLGEGVKW